MFVYAYFDILLYAVERLALIYGILSNSVGITSNREEINFVFI